MSMSNNSAVIFSGFPFPLWNSRDRRPVNFGNEDEDRFYHTVFAMNKYLVGAIEKSSIHVMKLFV